MAAVFLHKTALVPYTVFMNLLHVSGTADARDFLIQRIETLLTSGERVLLLLSGGSAMDMEIQALQTVAGHPQADSLLVSQVDERYGQAGHPDSNWQQLIDRGFDPESVSHHPILNGKGLGATAADFSSFLDRERKRTIIGVFGMGTDGHTAGILPGSSAIDETNTVAAYESSPYTRITVAPPFFSRVDLALLWAMGGEKQIQLERFMSDLSPADQPAQLLKQCRELYIFTHRS